MAGGRPKIEIDWKKIENLASIHCTQEEISFVMSISVDTLDRACKREHHISFAEFCQQKKAMGKMSLRRAMWDMAVIQKDKTMLIWLSKQHLDFSDKMETRGMVDEHVTIEELTDKFKRVQGQLDVRRKAREPIDIGVQLTPPPKR